MEWPTAYAWELAAAGLAAGFVATLLGVGGGLLMVPILHYGLGVEFKQATALSLAAMVLPSASGTFQHARKGAVDWRLAAGLSLGGLAGVLIGIKLQAVSPVLALKVIFAGLMLVAAWRLSRKLTEHAAPRVTNVTVAAIGALAGLASRLVGIGGGLVTGPLLTFRGVPVHRAVGSSMSAVFTNSLLATTVTLATGVLDLHQAGWLAAGALVAGPAGTWAAHALHPERLRRVFAGALVVAAVLLVGRELL